MTSIDRKSGIVATDNGWSVELSRNSLRVWKGTTSASFSMDKGPAEVIIVDDASDMPEAARTEMLGAAIEAMGHLGLRVTVQKRR